MASGPHPEYYMPAYPIYYVPQAFHLRSSVLNDSDSSDDDIPLAKIKSKENTKGTKKRGKHKEKQPETKTTSRRNDQKGVIDDSLIMSHELSRDTLEENSEITLFDSNSITLGQVDTQEIKSNAVKKKGRFSYLCKFFSYGNYFAVEDSLNQ